MCATPRTGSTLLCGLLASAGVAGRGRVRFVYLRRDDIVAQAVSLLRAEQTGVWHDPVQATRAEPDHDAQFDFDQVQQRVQMIDQHNSAWQGWFSAVGIEPFPVLYEELAVDPAGITHRILDFLGLELPPGRELAVQHRRLADELSASWIARYQAGGIVKTCGWKECRHL
jgi:trehalose 2-sulfotransferase